MQRIGIIGTSGMAREAGDIAFSLGLSPLYVAENHVEREKIISVFDEDVIVESDIEKYDDISYVVAIGAGKLREKIVRNLHNKISFSNLIHPSATFGKKQRAEFDRRVGNIVAAGARFTSGIVVNNFSIFNQNAAVAHDCIIEDFCHLAPGCCLSGMVHVGKYSWIGAGAVINQGDNCNLLHIGENTVIGSGAVVLVNCESNSTYVGIPARKIK